MWLNLKYYDWDGIDRQVPEKVDLVHIEITNSEDKVIARGTLIEKEVVVGLEIKIKWQKAEIVGRTGLVRWYNPTIIKTYD